MNGTSLLNSLWLKGECFTWKRTTKGGRFNHSWPLRKWYFYAFAFLTVQLFIRPFCRDCLRIKEDFKDFGHISFTWMQKLLFLSWVPGNCWDVYDIKACPFFISSWCCLLFSWERTRFVRLDGRHCFKFLSLRQYCASQPFYYCFLRSCSLGSYCLISLVLQPVSQVQSHFSETERTQT